MPREEVVDARLPDAVTLRACAAFGSAVQESGERFAAPIQDMKSALKNIKRLGAPRNSVLDKSWEESSTYSERQHPAFNDPRHQSDSCSSIPLSPTRSSTYFTSSRTLTTSSVSSKSSFTVEGGLHRVRPVPTVLHPAPSKAFTTSRPSKPVPTRIVRKAVSTYYNF